MPGAALACKTRNRRKAKETKTNASISVQPEKVEPEELVALVARDGGWMASVADVPIGFITPDGEIVTPSGAAYTVRGATGQFTLLHCASSALVSLVGQTLRDEKTGLEWDLREDWIRNSIHGEPPEMLVYLPYAFAREYSLEEAQGTVPNRVKLLLAWLVTRPDAV